MASVHSSVRESISLPARIAKRVLALAETKETSASRILVGLIETGLEAKPAPAILRAHRSARQGNDPAGRQRLQEEPARMTFAESQTL
jgi:hypothetical protein